MILSIRRIFAIFTVVTLLTGLLSGCVVAGKNRIVIGSKDYTENIIVGEIFAQMLETHTDLAIERKFNMGGTFVNFESIKNGEIDMYNEYTGTGLTAQLKMDVISDPDEAYSVVKREFDERFNIKWLEPLGFNNTYAVAIKKELADENNIVAASDLTPLTSDLVFGGEHEFFDRQDGYNGMIEKYGYNFKDVAKMQVALKYQAMGQGTINVTDVFTTDGQLITYNLVALEDDKNFFPPYYAAPIVRGEVLEAHPEIAEVLNRLAGQISNEEMQQMNYQADQEGKEIEDVAREFLQNKGLLG